MEAVRPERSVEVEVDTLAEFLVALTTAKGTVAFHFILSLTGKVLKSSFQESVGFIWCQERT